jgi:hypothetical protein
MRGRNCSHKFLETACDKQPIIQKQILTAVHAYPKWYEGWMEAGVNEAAFSVTS